MSTALTYQGYLALPNDGKRYEIHDGELSLTPATNRDHQHVILRLGAALLIHVTSHGLGQVFIAPFDVILRETTVVQPDLIFVAADRAAVVHHHGIEGAPTLVVEILSPSTARTDRSIKLKLYARLGVTYYWIVDIDGRAIDVYRAVGGEYGPAARFSGGVLTGLPPLPELRLDATSLWPNATTPA